MQHDIILMCVNYVYSCNKIIKWTICRLYFHYYITIIPKLPQNLATSVEIRSDSDSLCKIS